MSAAEIAPKLGELSTALEERVLKVHQGAALEEVKTEHKGYFDALNKHPRMLVGTEVPALNGTDGKEKLVDEADAKSWQDAVKQLLVSEVQARATKAMDGQTDFLQTLHASIELFQQNADLVPGTKDFDVDLANRFVALVKPYELRVEGKLQGYSIPVQPIINQLRVQISAERQAQTAAPAAASPAAGAASPAAPAAPVDPPQAGIPSKPGSSGEAKEDFSTFFGTIGLPNLQI